jgi:hypothetical protein
MKWDNDSDRTRFLQAFRALCELHGRDVSKGLTRLYFEAVSAYPVEKVERAISGLILKGMFFPKPVELTEMLNGGPTEAIAKIEAAKVWDAISAVGRYQSVAFDNPVTQAVIMRTFGGWMKACETPESERKWFMHEFAKAYAAFSAQGIKHHGVLLGEADQQNAAHPYPNAPKRRVALIGDKKKAMEVASIVESDNRYASVPLESVRADSPRHLSEILKLPKPE